MSQKMLKNGFMGSSQKTFRCPVRVKFQTAVRKIKVLSRLGIQDYQAKLEQQYVNFKEDAQFIAMLLKKENRALNESMFLQRAFQKMKFFQEHQQNLSPEIYDTLFAKVKYFKRRAQEILFQYGSNDQVYYIILSGQVTFLVPSTQLADKLENNQINATNIRRNTRNLLIKYYTKIENKRQSELTKQPQFNISGDYEAFLAQTFPDFDPIKNMVTGDSFGEIALINRSKRTATVICKTDCEFMTLGADVFDLVLKQQERKFLRLKYQFLNKMQETHNLQEARKNDLIHSIQIFKPRMFETIYKENEEAKYIYYINSGEVELSKTIKNDTHMQKVRISLCMQGCIFGLEEVQQYQPRNLTAICHSRTSEMFTLPRDVYDQIFKRQYRIQTTNSWRTSQIQSQINNSQNFLQQREFVDPSPVVVKKRDNINLILKNQVLNSSRQAFQTDTEITGVKSFNDKLNAIRDGFFFCELTESHQKLLHIQKLRDQFQTKKKYGINLSQSIKKINQSQESIRSTSPPKIIFSNRVITLPTKKINTLPTKPTTSPTRTITSPTKFTTSPAKSIDISYKFIHSQQKTQRQSTHHDIEVFKPPAELSIINLTDRSINSKKKIVMFSQALRKVKLQKTRYFSKNNIDLQSMRIIRTLPSEQGKELSTKRTGSIMIRSYNI